MAIVILYIITAYPNPLLPLHTGTFCVVFLIVFYCICSLLYFNSVTVIGWLATVLNRYLSSGIIIIIIIIQLWMCDLS